MGEELREKESRRSVALELPENLASTAEKPQKKKVKTIATGIMTKQHGLVKKNLEKKKDDCEGTYAQAKTKRENVKENVLQEVS